MRTSLKHLLTYSSPLKQWHVFASLSLHIRNAIAMTHWLRVPRAPPAGVPGRVLRPPGPG